MGDAIAALISSVVISEAARMGAPKVLLLKMAFNVLVDSVVGAIPLVGDLFDIGWKSKLRNVDLLERHLKDQAAKAPPTGNVEGRMSSHHPTLNN